MKINLNTVCEVVLTPMGEKLLLAQSHTAYEFHYNKETKVLKETLGLIMKTFGPCLFPQYWELFKDGEINFECDENTISDLAIKIETEKKNRLWDEFLSKSKSAFPDYEIAKESDPSDSNTLGVSVKCPKHKIWDVRSRLYDIADSFLPEPYIGAVFVRK